jgi:hypothetical protein
MEAAEIEQMSAIRDAFFGRHEGDDEVRYTAIDLQHQKYIVLWVMEMEMEYTI